MGRTAVDHAGGPRRRCTDVEPPCGSSGTTPRPAPRARGARLRRAAQRTRSRIPWWTAGPASVRVHIDAAAAALAEGRDTLAMMRRIAITMFVLGGLTCLSGVWMTQATPDSKLGQGLVAGALVASGLVIWAVPRPRLRLMQVSVLWGIGLISVLIALSNPLGMAPLFYLWPVVFAAYFFSARVLAASYGWMAVSLAVGLVVNPTLPLKLDTFTGTSTTVGLMAVLVAVMTTQESRLRHELAVAADTDPLTGLLNRRSFNPRLETLLKAADEPLSIVLFDLDHFKRLNDEHGHLAGDRVLEDVAAILRARSRCDDLVSRFGGEEFVVALPGADAVDARRYTERLGVAFHALSPVADFTVSVSAGISARTAERECAETLLTQADAALYAAKEAGRGRHASWVDGVEVGPVFGERTPA